MTKESDKNIFIVDHLVQKRIIRRKTEYLVKWKGYDESENTWERSADILDKELIKNFNKKSIQEKKKTIQPKSETKKRKFSPKKPSKTTKKRKITLQDDVPKNQKTNVIQKEKNKETQKEKKPKQEIPQNDSSPTKSSFYDITRFFTKTEDTTTPTEEKNPSWWNTAEKFVQKVTKVTSQFSSGTDDNDIPLDKLSTADSFGGTYSISQENKRKIYLKGCIYEKHLLFGKENKFRDAIVELEQFDNLDSLRRLYHETYGGIVDFIVEGTQKKAKTKSLVDGVVLIVC